jgi:tRNA(His) 5'-end guanylyltransferase
VYSETEFHYDQADPESDKAVMEMMEAEQKNKLGEKYGFEHSDICIAILSTSSDLPWEKRVKKLGELSSSFHVWQERIKRALDPHDICDRSSYGVGMLGKDLKV